MDGELLKAQYIKKNPLSTGYLQVLVRVLNDFAQGVVLNEQHVLTAASVVTEGNRSINHFWVRITAGDNHVMGSSMNREERTLSHLFIHDQFNHQTGVNNLAILRLSTPFTFPHNTIEGAILNNRIIPVGTSVQFAGWQFPIPVVRIINLKLLILKKLMKIIYVL